ncbi:MAG: anti-sigma factor antagonist [Chrysiogenales bacterium]|nr:MAG: anti-sigma factor antagonist [Chrysiogenales bacterium]
MGVLQYSSSRHGNVMLIRIGGSLDAETAPKFDGKISGEINKGVKKIVCNMEKLDYIASAGLGVLIGANDMLGKQGGEIRLSAMNEKIRKIFKLLGFINLFKIFEDDQKAIDSF